MVNYGAKELAAAARVVRGNTIKVAEDIPEDKFGFAASEGTRTVAQLFAHIANGPALAYDIHRDRKVSTLQGYDWGKFIGDGMAFENVPRTKAELLALLKETGEQYATWVESLSDEFLNETYTDPMGQNPKTRFENIMGVKEHEMHHRGQLMVVLRLVGGVPHLTRERMARAAAAAK